MRRLQGLEVLANVDAVVFDKTGTLTSDVLAVRVTRVRDGLVADDALVMAAALAGKSLHPVARALTLASRSYGGALKWTVHDASEHAGQGMQGLVAPADASFAARRLRLGSAAFCGLAPHEVGRSQTFLCDERGWLATFELEQHIRPDARATVQALANQGIIVHLLSGDHAGAAARVAGQLCISHLCAACTPDDKLAYLYLQRKQGHHIAMVGD